MARLVGQLVARGLRAQPRSGNLLTGQLYIALDFIPGARPEHFVVDARPLEIPTVPGSIEELQRQLVVLNPGAAHNVVTNGEIAPEALFGAAETFD